ncbi:MAG: YidC/Oxa1 family membrane protein insertase [Clostridia bacterium]|nr:YidC/Oxa1 family membrane protein insertase [Clostridia bacterium]
MISFFANIFGYFLNFLYINLGNFGLAIILFSIVVKIVLLPVTIKQQKTMKKTAKVQQKLKEIQDKYKNNPEKLNQETIELYKREKMSPFSGCLGAIVQIILLFSVFYLVRSPLTYMKKVDNNLIEQYKIEIEEENSTNNAYPEISIIKQKGNVDEKVYINMNFLGLDLSGVPIKDTSDIKVFIIPALYVITTFFSMRLNSSINKKKGKNVLITDGKEEKKEDAIQNPMEQANKNMMYIMPIMSISIALVAPLGLALYWLVNNVLMIIERLVLNNVIKDEENN